MTCATCDMPRNHAWHETLEECQRIMAAEGRECAAPSEHHEYREATVPDETYNGWANRETWAVSLWLGNDSADVDEESRRAARDLVARGDHPDTFREYVEGYIFGEEAPANLGTDLIAAALSRVDWRSVVEARAED